MGALVILDDTDQGLVIQDEPIAPWCEMNGRIELAEVTAVGARSFSYRERTDKLNLSFIRCPLGSTR